MNVLEKLGLVVFILGANAATTITIFGLVDFTSSDTWVPLLWTFVGLFVFVISDDKEKVRG